LQQPGGLEQIYQIVLEAVPLHMHDTAYAIAVEVAVIDREMRLEEARVLHRLRSWLAIDDTTARAIELSAKARHRRSPDRMERRRRTNDPPDRLSWRSLALWRRLNSGRQGLNGLN
jgi:hypothetical protein